MRIHLKNLIYCYTFRSAGNPSLSLSVRIIGPVGGSIVALSQQLPLSAPISPVNRPLCLLSFTLAARRTWWKDGRWPAELWPSAGTVPLRVLLSTSQPI